VIRARAALVEVRTRLINVARGMSKSFGERLRRCDARSVDQEMAQGLTEGLQAAIKALLEQLGEMSAGIQELDDQIQQIARDPEVELLTAVGGIGVLIARTFILTLEDPQQFQRSRDVGAYGDAAAATAEQPERSEVGHQ
jgi:transposase